jgi:hypothetical protein
VCEVSGSRNWLDHYDDRLTEAVGRDGSAMLRLSHRSFKLYFMPDENYDRVRIVLPATVQTFEIEHSLKEFRELGGMWQFSEGWRVDPDCLMTAADAGEVGRKSGAYPMVAGVRAVEYVYSTGGGRFVQRMAFAPTLGCTAVEWDYSERSAVGLPLRAHHLRLVSATLGEPDPNLFAIPRQYRPMDREKPWKYHSLNIFPGDIQVTPFSKPIT